MNRFFHHPWIVPFFIFILLSSLMYVFYHQVILQQTVSLSLDRFEDAAQPSQEELDAANTNYAALLLFLQKYPAKSIPFIKDMKDKLYGDNCTVKPSIDFEHMAKFPNGMVFV